ncbi:MAG TPA: hypothetical protein PKE31_19705 [Pseudomonadota bacterium]|nr:hypothetical protein [Pseudomonadota bacterium]
MKISDGKWVQPIQAGSTSAAVSAQLGHSSFAITKMHYVAPGSVENAQAVRVEESLTQPQESPDLIQHLEGLGPEQLAALKKLLDKL